ncbi:hypothetical protein AAFF_G00176140 [Aldrovandia affinis]|uniref:Uncharacterized protein n=1 Tax=Aldrovandia affinis TaxID=143900 RepID=A0AAD7W7F5_9TELE|nr:hypothetical protein AAFF_G00176140 [Aldrovandia affinis]
MTTKVITRELVLLFSQQDRANTMDPAKAEDFAQSWLPNMVGEHQQLLRNISESFAFPNRTDPAAATPSATTLPSSSKPSSSH